MKFDDDGAKGEVELVRGPYGPTIKINGKDVGYIDLFYCTKQGRIGGDVIQLIIFDEGHDEPLLKVVWEDKTRVVVNKEAVETQSKYRIYNEGDHVYGFAD